MKRVGSVTGVVMLVLGALLGVTSAWAQLESVPSTGRPGYLELAADPYPAQFKVAPTQDGHWLIEARLADAERSTLTMQLDGEGDLVSHPEGLEIKVSSCATAYEVTNADMSTATCPRGFQEVVPPSRLADLTAFGDGRQWQLADLEADSPRQFLVTLSLPEATNSREAIVGRIGVGFHASGESEAVAKPPQNPRESHTISGVRALPMLLIAGGAIVLGASVRRGKGVAQ